MDFSQMSDAELEQLAGGQAPAQLKADFSKMSDEELETLAGSPRQPQQVPQKSFKDKALDAAIYVGEKVDQYTGAPARSALSAAIEGDNPMLAFSKQFGEKPSLAPTGKQIAQKVGVTDASLSDAFPGRFTNDDKEAESYFKFKKGGPADISGSGAAGLAVDLIADPLNLAGVGVVKNAASGALKGVTAIAKGAAGLGVEGAKLAGKAASTSKALGVIGDVAKSGATKLAQGLTGVPTRNIEVYAKHTDEINNIIKKYGGDISLMSDDVRTGFNRAIENTKSGLNKTIERGLELSPKEKNIDVSWVRETIDNAKTKVNEVLNPEVIKDLDDMFLKVGNVSDSWKTNARDLHDMKKYMQDLAKGSYKKDGQIFVLTGEAKRTAKEIASKLRKQLNAVAPDVAEANNTLSRLHSIDDKINGNLIGVGKSESALLNAGAGTNTRATRQIQELGKITGKDFVGEAEKLSAAKTFASPQIMPMDTTGKSAARMGAAYLIGGIPAVALTSPMSLKAAINAKKIPQGVISVFSKGAKGAEKNIDQIYAKMNTPAGRKIIQEISRGSRVASIGSGKPAASQGSDGDSNIASYKGENKWAIDGYANLMDQDKSLESDAFMEKALSNPKSKKLLVQASTLSPGSKQMANIITQLKQMDGQ